MPAKAHANAELGKKRGLPENDIFRQSPFYRHIDRNFICLCIGPGI